MFIHKKKQSFLSDPEFIISIVSDMLRDENSRETTNSATFAEKIKELGNKDTSLEQMRENLEKEKQDLEKKIQDSTSNLHVEHARLYASINNLSLGFIMIDKERKIIMLNKAIRNFFNIQSVETTLQLQDLQTYIKGNINILQSCEEALRDNRQFVFEDVVVDGKYTNIFVSPIINASTTIGAVILIEDKSEERLIRRSRKNFFVIASHELRTPLTGIKGYIALIKQLYLDQIHEEELKRIINDIDVSSSRLINIINEFLDTSRLEQDKMRVRFVPCDLIQIVQSSIEETNSIATEKKLFITFNNPLSSAMVTGESDKIKQILINLISNSVKYTEEGGITIGIEKTAMNTYKVSIADTGKGIPQENIRSLFSKYQQSDPNKKENVVSSGLGLYISKLLAEKMHGSVVLERSEVGKGSTFVFEMPVYGGES